jgi:apolipoprotein N-acyltransferase
MKKYRNIILLLLATLCLILQSPKWFFPIATWIAPVFILLLTKENKWLKGSLLAFISFAISGLIGQYNVMPFPLPIFIIVVVIGSIFNLLPFIADKFFLRKKRGYWRTLILPSAFVLKEYFQASSSSGVWQSISGTQNGFLALVQSASVVGIFGVVFLIYWFASTIVFILEVRQDNPRRAKKSGVIFISVIAIILTFGFIRLSHNNTNSRNVKVAAVTVDNSIIYETIYKCVTGNDISFKADISPSAPEFVEVNKALIEFLSDSDNEKFIPVKSVMINIHTKAFEKSKVASQNESKIILWSEGLGLTMLEDKDELILKGQQFAKENNVYLLLAYAAFFKGIPVPGKSIYENRVITINPDGEIVNVFDKNVPVPNVERSAPGDGTIPIIKTEYANISPSICYDADFPGLIAQTGKSETELLLIPTSDWESITPYHSYITRYRAIENGISVIKSTNKGLSVAYDQYGRIIGENNFFNDKSKILIVDVPVKKVKTIYPIIGDLFAKICVLFFIIVFIIHLIIILRNKFFNRKF